MGRRKTAAAVLALVFSLLSHSAVLGASEKEMAEQPQYVKIETVAENPEAIAGNFIPVLMYHHFAIRDMGSGNDVVTTVQELEDHLRTFRAEGYKVISLEELDKLLKQAEKKPVSDGNGLNLGRKYLCITMDDGYYSNYELAYPLFQKYRSPASVFAVTDYVTEQIGIKKFTWKQAQEMEESGYVKVYSHSANHQAVTAGEEELFLASMQKSEETLQENLEKDRVKAMAYPNGRYTETAQQLLTEDGYQMQFTIEEGVLTAAAQREAMPRITIVSGMSGQDVIRKIELAAEKDLTAAERKGISNEKENHCGQLENE